MSKKNRLKVYNKLKAAGKLSQDDGSLEKEFGTLSSKPTTPKASPASAKGGKK